MIDPDEPLRSARIVVFDTETTGLSATSDHVIEIGALALEDGVETGRFESLIDPGEPIPPEMTAIHGITDAMVRGKPRFPEVAGRFIEFAGDAVLAAHNAPFDVSMMIVPLRTAGLRPAGNPVIDTCRLARHLIPAPNHQLATVARVLGIGLTSAHRAMADVEACAGVLRACLDRMGRDVTLAEIESASRTRLDFGVGPRSFTPVPEHLAPIEEALRTGGAVEIVYRGGSHGDQPRPITPLFVLVLDGALNISAQCHIENALKNFRLDRIAAARPARRDAPGR